MATKTISITEEAYERLRSLKKNDKASFSDVILEHYPKKKKLSEVLKEIGANPDNYLTFITQKGEYSTQFLLRSRFLSAGFLVRLLGCMLVCSLAVFLLC